MNDQRDTSGDGYFAETILNVLKNELEPEVLTGLQELLAFLPPEARDVRDPRRELLRILGDKWSAFILLILSAGRFRHASLRRTIGIIEGGDGISQPVLTQKLRNLERNGLILRHATTDVPPQVDYMLTPMGVEFTNRCKSLIDWMGALADPIEYAREQFAV